MSDFASGRPLNPRESTMFAAAARDDAMARHLYDYGSRQIGPLRFLSPPLSALNCTYADRAKDLV